MSMSMSMSMQNGQYNTPSHSNHKKEEEEKQGFPYRNFEGKLKLSWHKVIRRLDCKET